MDTSDRRVKRQKDWGIDVILRLHVIWILGAKSSMGELLSTVPGAESLCNWVGGWVYIKYLGAFPFCGIRHGFMTYLHNCLTRYL